MTDIEQALTFGMHRDEQDRVFLRVGERMYPAVSHIHEDSPIPDDGSSIVGGSIYRTRRVRLRFESGWELSVTWGTMTYCENRDRYHNPERPDPHRRPHTEFTETPRDVECMAFPPDGWACELNEYDEGPWDDPFGWVTVPMIQALIDGMNSGDPKPPERR